MREKGASFCSDFRVRGSKTSERVVEASTPRYIEGAIPPLCL